MKIEIISGSPREKSNTHRVAVFLQKYLQETTTHEVGLIDVRDWNLQNIDSSFQSVNDAPQNLKAIAQQYFDADAFILVTPEYNGSYTAALKNFVDFFPKQSRKAFGLVTASTGGFGGMRATQQLLLLVPALFGVACPNMLVVPHVSKYFSEDGNLQEPLFKAAVQNFTEEFVWLSEALYTKKINS